MTTPRCFIVHAQDNVATLLDDAAAGAVAVIGAARRDAISLREPIRLGHKVALEEIAAGAAVVKYGAAIGRATRTIRPGEWVHLHNCRSLLDERSAALDVETGAATDTKYE
jgi:altronate dehydratase small subunit